MDVDGNAQLTPERLARAVLALTDAKNIWVAYSGGIDSHVLLHLCVHAFRRTDRAVSAVHVHHGLSHHADVWVQHCESICAALQVPFSVLWVDAGVTDGNSPEEAAREARFAAWARFLTASDCLLLAHHAADQAETILLRLFRGAGPLGLGGMQSRVMLGESHVVRPLLTFSKEALLDYARGQNLHWIEDDSNANKRFDRNFLRHDIMPLLMARWPRVVRSIHRAGSLCFETATAVQVLAAQDLENIADEAGSRRLSVSKLLQLDGVRRRGVLRYWLRTLGLKVPSRAHMQRIDREILRARPGARSRLKIGQYVLRRIAMDIQVEVYDAAG